MVKISNGSLEFPPIALSLSYHMKLLDLLEEDNVSEETLLNLYKEH